MKGFVVIVCVALCGLAESSDEPFIRPCREKDLVCLKESAQAAVPLLAAGVPSMGIAVMDPMFVKQVKTTQAGLQMDFRNTTVTGLKHCKVESLERHGHITKLALKCSVIMTGDYTLGGKLLIMPIQGDGQYTINIHDIVVKIQFHVVDTKKDGNVYWMVKDWQYTSEVEKGVHFRFENLFNGNKLLYDIVVKIQFHVVDTKKDGNVYWMVKDWQYTSEVEKGVHFRFENLFNGNKLLSKAVHTFANSNWRGIFEEVAPPIVKVIVTQLVGESTKLFNEMPVKKLVIE